MNDWAKINGVHKSITFCEWMKDETGYINKQHKINENKDKWPIYLLLGGAKAKGDKTHSARDNVLDKQKIMVERFKDKARTVGMRGIWFNTFSIARDIKSYSDEIWSAKNAEKRWDLWLSGDNRQNVVSLDFLDKKKAYFIIIKNRCFKKMR